MPTATTTSASVRQGRTKNPLLEKYLRAKTLRPNDAYVDPLGRKEGQSLDPVRLTPEVIAKRQAESSPRSWSSQEQQDPQAEGVGLIDRRIFTGDGSPGSSRILKPNIFAETTEGIRFVRYWDLAYTAKQYNKPDPDWTVGVKMGFKRHQRMQQAVLIYVADMVRFRANVNEMKARVIDTALSDGPEVYIGGPGIGPEKAGTQDLRSIDVLMGYRIVEVPINKEKSVGANLWADRAMDGLMFLREGEWLEAFYAEAEAFPNGAHDDIIDSFTGAYMLCAMVFNEAPRQAQQTSIELFKRW